MPQLMSYAVRFSSDPTLKHWNFVQHILKYLNSIHQTEIVYKKCKSLNVNSYAVLNNVILLPETSFLRKVLQSVGTAANNLRYLFQQLKLKSLP